MDWTLFLASGLATSVLFAKNDTPFSKKMAFGNKPVLLAISDDYACLWKHHIHSELHAAKLSIGVLNFHLDPIGDQHDAQYLSENKCSGAWSCIPVLFLPDVGK